MGGSTSTRVVYHHTPVYVETAAQRQEKERLAREKKKAEELERKRNNPLLFGLNEEKGFQDFLKEIPNLKLPTVIFKKTAHEKHVGFFGPTSVGKSTLVNCLAKKKVALVGLSKVTVRKELLFVKENLHLWDIPGHTVGEFDYFKPENLALIKQLDVVIFLFDKSPKNVERFVKTAEILRSGARYLYCRTKCDMGEKETEVFAWTNKDGQFLSQVTGRNIHVCALSGRNIWRNIRNGNENENKFEFEKMLVEIMK